jgi:hypothetical protein
MWADDIQIHLRLGKGAVKPHHRTGSGAGPSGDKVALERRGRSRRAVIILRGHGTVTCGFRGFSYRRGQIEFVHRFRSKGYMGN